jgi:peptidoglycan/LPS O-acetylase OafA/YrhL
LCGKTNAILVIFSMYILSIIGVKLNISYLIVLSHEFSFSYFNWFVMGSLVYLYYVEKKIKYLIFSVLISLLEFYQCIHHHDFGKLIFMIFILIVFIVPVCFEKIRFLLSNKILLFFGLISYPLYLIHENAMISLICKINKTMDMPYILLPVIPIIILVLISYFIVKILEPFLLKIIKRVIFSVKESKVKVACKL